MIKLQRLTEDSSWLLEWEGTRLLIDPWLIGSEVDGGKWINEQWHRIDPVPIDDLPDYDAILISQSYEDHCHSATLKELDEGKPILATPKAYKKLKKLFPKRNIQNIIDTTLLNFGEFEIRSFTPDKLLDPIYYAVVIKTSSKEGIFYSPHGFALKDSQLDLIKSIDFKLLITTFTEFDLPAILGGKVNPGMNNVRELYSQITPDNVVNTHDEEKIMKGLVARTANITYANYEDLEQSEDLNFTYIKGYDPVEIS